MHPTAPSFPLSLSPPWALRFARTLWQSPVRSILAVAFAVGLGFASSGCENKAIGRPCEVEGNQTAMGSGLQNQAALECPTRMCVLPTSEVGAVDTAPFCTAECSNDDDCEDAEKRDAKNPNDKRCKTGFTCAVPLQTGGLCCKKLCVCKDFLNNGRQSTPPKTCDKSTGISECANLR